MATSRKDLNISCSNGNEFNYELYKKDDTACILLLNWLA